MDWLTTAGSILFSLAVTFVFNYFVGIPKKWREKKDEELEKEKTLMDENRKRDERLAVLERTVNAFPLYKKQNERVQADLQQTDTTILELCRTIQEDVMQNRYEVLEKLTRLESREKNALRAKILQEYRLYTDEIKNPKKAWSEMEHHSFFELIKDYEALGGNDYVHRVILPEMNKLDVIPMNNLQALKEMYDSRSAK